MVTASVGGADVPTAAAERTAGICVRLKGTPTGEASSLNVAVVRAGLSQLTWR
jgi:hypothetical protein